MKKLLYGLSALIVLVFANGCQKPDGFYYVENPNWYVEYAGRGWDPDYGDTDYVDVYVTAGHEDYLVTIGTASDLDRMGIDGFIESSLPGFEMQLDELNRNPYGDYYTWADISWSGNSRVDFDPFNERVLHVAVAFAVYSNGRPTGSYSVSEPFYPGEKAVRW